MKNKELSITLDATPSSRKGPKQAFAKPNVYELARKVLHLHIRESQGLFISDDELPIKGPITEDYVKYSITILQHEKDPETTRLLEDVAGLSIYESARTMAREAVAAQV